MKEKQVVIYVADSDLMELVDNVSRIDVLNIRMVSEENEDITTDYGQDSF